VQGEGHGAGKVLKRELRKSGEYERGIDSRGMPLTMIMSFLRSTMQK
jgi:hypothetical protein